MRAAVFLDRDGVVCRNRDDYVKSWEEFIFLPGALKALSDLARSELSIVVITNQSVIGRGLAPVEVVEDIHARMVQAIGAAGGRVDRVLYCPHRPDEQCACRKPKPGLLLMAAREMRLDLSGSYVVGDAEADMQAGRAAGCQHRFLVLTGRGPRELIRCRLHGEKGFEVMGNLEAATNAILCCEGRDGSL
jgi:histidinol-phosphate phosphatase family protein